MKKRRLGKSALFVSEIGLGTMTFGTQVSEKKECFQIMDHAIAEGVNFFDTAEIYPVPPTQKLVGVTEQIIGEWLSSRARESVLIATKIAGPAHGWFNPPVREGNNTIDGFQIRRALEGSLKRMGTDYVDLYQLHWPDHGMRMEDALETLDALVREGKIRAIGCSNETAYGLMKGLWTADKNGWRGFDSIQNNFSLNNRRFQDELAQVCEREQVSLLPYSPLAGGVLSGKYNTENMPQDSRFYDYLKNGMPRQRAMAERFVNPKSLALTTRLMEISKEVGIDIVTLASAWSKQHSYVASTLIGVSSFSQLDPILQSSGLELSEDILGEIDNACRENLYPMG